MAVDLKYISIKICFKLNLKLELLFKCCIYFVNILDFYKYEY